MTKFLMAILISAHQLRKSFGTRPLFDGLTFSIESNERIGLIGPNGAGKSTLLRILAGHDDADAGDLSKSQGLIVGFLEQVPQFKPNATVMESVLEGAGTSHDPQHRAQELLSRLSISGVQGIGPDTLVGTLSGGWKKRVALARELLCEPDLLLLDEPTNHLDLDSIQWLESFLEYAPFATLTITHDRLFLQRISNRILELDRRNPGGLLSVAGDYAHYLEVKESLMATQEIQETRLKNTLRRETEWLRQGAKARTTKQQARINRAGELKETVEELTFRNRTDQVKLDFQGAEKNPKKLLVVRGASKSYDRKLVVPPLDLLITPKSRIGLLGPNGCGKSTLIRLLTGEEDPDVGEVIHSDLLKPIVFEQNRESLDPNETLVRTLCPRGDSVIFQGRSVHIKSYLDRFLFSGAQMEMAVGKLSGGEQSRLLIARLMLEEANLLILDEPTNDLDLATLNVLADVLRDFAGAIVLVTHDRFFLDQVTDTLLAFEQEDGEKKIISFSGLSQWEAWKKTQNASRSKKDSTTTSKSSVEKPTQKRQRLSYNEQREYDTMETTIQMVEQKLAQLTLESHEPKLTSDAVRLTEITSEMSRLQDEVDRLYARWAELESR